MNVVKNAEVQKGFKTRIYPVREDSSAPYDGIPMIVDEEDVPKLKDRKWHIRRCNGIWEVYSSVGKNKESVCGSSVYWLLHRLIMDLEPQTNYPWVHFKDGCVHNEEVPEMLDFRKSNLCVKEMKNEKG